MSFTVQHQDASQEEKKVEFGQKTLGSQLEFQTASSEQPMERAGSTSVFIPSRRVTMAVSNLGKHFIPLSTRITRLAVV